MIILIAILLFVSLLIVIYFLRPKKITLFDTCAKEIEKAESKICCAVNGESHIYTYFFTIENYVPIATERLFVNGMYKTSHQRKGTVEEAINSRIKDIKLRGAKEIVSYLDGEKRR